MKKALLLAVSIGAMAFSASQAEAGCVSANSSKTYWELTNGCREEVIVRFQTPGYGYGLSDRIRVGQTVVISPTSRSGTLTWWTCGWSAYSRNQCSF